MNTQACMNSTTHVCHGSAILGTVFLASLLPLMGRAAQPAAPNCDALVSVANDLYLVGSTGAVITRFTSDGTVKMYSTVSPDGRQVAYVSPNSDEVNIVQYEVADSNGSQRAFPVNIGSDSSNTHNVYDAYPLVGLRWDADGILQTRKHVSPSTSLFEFHRIDSQRRGWGRGAEVGFGVGCTMKSDGGLVACVQGSGVRVDNQRVFAEFGFSTTPLASFVLTVGDSAATPSGPTFTVSVVGVHDGKVGLKVTSPNGTWETGYIPNDQMYFTTWWNGVQYGFSANLRNTGLGRVEIKEYQGHEAGTSNFDSAIAWRPRGNGLLVIRREGAEALLYLLRPTGFGQDSREGRWRDWSWGLGAQALVNLPNGVKAMRFVTPSFLLFQAANGVFSWAPIRISSGSGGTSLTVGAITRLPSTVPATIGGSTTQATALDWSCQASSRDGGD